MRMIICESGDQKTLAEWMKKIMAKADKSDAPLLPAVENLKHFIENDPKAYMFFTQMFDEVPRNKKTTSSGLPQVRDYMHMLKLFNVILTHAPDYDETGFVGFPFNAILDWSMATEGGWAGFINSKVNCHIKAILDQWGRFLKSSDSTYVLNADPRSGWFGEDAKKAMPDFTKEFVCDPSQPHYGFHSWDDFFVRQFRPGIRPVASPDDDSIVVNACESAPFALAREVKMRDKFWIKAQPYALQFMLNNDPRASHFAGGTVYQAFLSALSYHRWHAPVSGKIVKTAAAVLIPFFTTAQTFDEHLSADKAEKPESNPRNEFFKRFEVLYYCMYAKPARHWHKCLKKRKHTGNTAHFTILHTRLIKSVCKRYRKSIHRKSYAEKYAVEKESESQIHF